MNQLNQLKIKSLFKKYDYYSSEIEWKEEYINENESNFMEYTQTIIDSHDELKELYYNIRNMKKEKIFDRTEDLREIERTINHSNKDPKVKKLFRKIVKKTHPDLIIDKKLNKMYLEVVELYENNDLLQIYRICNELGIEYELDITEEYIAEEINKLQNRILFLENSYIYRWIEDEDKRDTISLEYINQQLY